MISQKLIFECTSELNVLYVEDDEDLLSSTTELFNFYFKNVDTAVNGLDGLEKYTKYANETGSFYDIVITDINMPKCNGIDMSKKIVAQNERQTIIITTAHNDPDCLLDAIDIGISNYIVKPMNKEQLLNAMFKVSQAITDAKMVNRYIDEVENLNVDLLGKNSELLKINAELDKSSRILDTIINKEEISKPHKHTSAPINEEEQDVKKQILQLVNDDLSELKDILIEIDIHIIYIINNPDSVSKDKLNKLAHYFTKYSSVLSCYAFFQDLGIAMSRFVKVMNDEPLPQNVEDVKNIFTILESFIYVLSKWQDDISSDNESKVNQFDASIISDMNTIINMWTQKVEESSGDDLDGIFDF